MRSTVTDEKSTCDWKVHWGFEKAPFADRDSPYVSLPAHDEAALRLVQCVKNAERIVFLTADSGLGKTTVLRRVLAETRSPRLRSVSVSCRARQLSCWPRWRTAWANASDASLAGWNAGVPSIDAYGSHRSKVFTSSSESTTAKTQVHRCGERSSRLRILGTALRAN